MSDKIVTVRLCRRCNHVDDLVPLVIYDPVTKEPIEVSQRCPCPHDQLTAQVRARDVARRHQAAVIRARGRCQIPEAL